MQALLKEEEQYSNGLCCLVRKVYYLKASLNVACVMCNAHFTLDMGGKVCTVLYSCCSYQGSVFIRLVFFVTLHCSSSS